jgi:Ca-activated chloride channel family protein
MIADFHFLRPWWLLGIPVALLLIWLALRRGDVRRLWQGLIAPDLLAHLVVHRNGTSRFRPIHLAAVVIALGSLAAAGPTFRRERPPFVEDQAALAVAVDLSQTMDAIDVSPSRLERVKLKIHDLMGRRPGARTALFAYAGSAHLVLPPTEDQNLLSSYVDALATRIMPVAGRDTAKALQTMATALAGETAPGTLLFFTDGIEPGARQAFQHLPPGWNALILGIGTAEGGPVKTADGAFLTDAAGARVVARLDAGAFEAMRGEGVEVAAVTLDDSDVDWVTRRIRSHFEAAKGQSESHWRDLGWWLTIPIAAASLFGFRRGWSVAWALLIVVPLAWGQPGPAMAEPLSWQDMWLTPDQQGRLAFQHGDFAVASERFADPMWRGAALYRAGRFAEALDAFAQRDTAESYFNQGNTFAHLGRLDEAAASYRQALARRPGWPAAKANLALVERLAAARKKDDQAQPQDPNEKPDEVRFDDKGKKGKAGEVNIARQTAEMWMRNIQISPTDLLARRFALEAGSAKP